MAIVAPLVPEAWMAIAATCFATFGHGFWVSNLHAPTDLFPGQEMGTASGFSGMGGAVGGVLANLGTGSIVQHFSYAPVFLMAALMHPLSRGWFTGCCRIAILEDAMKPLLGLTLLCVVLIVAPLLVALPPVRQTPWMLAAARAATLARRYSLRWSRCWSRYASAPYQGSDGPIAARGYLRRAVEGQSDGEAVFAVARGVETAPIDAFHDVRDTDMVLGVTIEGHTRAYPVRYLAYHHMLNDQLGVTVLLPTY